MTSRQISEPTDLESHKAGPDDARYLIVVEKRFNKRFSARPDYVWVVNSTDQVVSAVERSVKEGRRLAVTSGGHCLEAFVSDPDVQVMIDVSPMKRVYHDAEKVRLPSRPVPRSGRRSVLSSKHGEWFCRSVSTRQSEWADTWSVAPLVSSAGNWAWQRTTCTRSKS